MSTFEVKVVKINAIESIPNADAIELARIADYRSVVKKGDYKVGDLAVYIPEASVVPELLLEKMGLTGKLAGKDKNRVKAIKLRGCLSQGILYPVKTAQTRAVYINETNVIDLSGISELTGLELPNQIQYEPVQLGDDVSELLGITKYEPPIPTHMAGEVCNIGSENVLKFDIENIKKYPDIFVVGEEISVTEKLHGTFCQIGYVPGLEHPEIFENGEVFVCSKGLGAQGLVFKNNENNTDNLYVKALKELTKDNDWMYRLAKGLDTDLPIYVLGEIFGKGVQDLDYGTTTPQFRVFDIYVGKAGQGAYLPPKEMQEVAKILDLPTVTEVYNGPFDRTKIDELAKGTTTTGANHVREGIVIKPTKERLHDEIGRVFLKHINEAYLLRNDKNATEYQ